MKKDKVEQDLRDWLEPWFPADDDKGLPAASPTIASYYCFPLSGRKWIYLSSGEVLTDVEVIDHTSQYIMVKGGGGVALVNTAHITHIVIMGGVDD